MTPVAEYGTIIVWLDNDGTEVDRHRDNIARQLRSLGKRVEVVGHMRDPKKYSPDMIRAIIEEELISF